jgi:hypothetical protein
MREGWLERRKAGLSAGGTAARVYQCRGLAGASALSSFTEKYSTEALPRMRAPLFPLSDPDAATREDGGLGGREDGAGQEKGGETGVDAWRSWLAAASRIVALSRLEK